MKIVALLGVRSEVELIRSSIAHLRAIGVDLTIAFDEGSTDGTLDVLRELEAEDLWVVPVKLPPEISKDEWRLDYSRRANADWLLFIDADEFWLPASGSLRDCDALVDADVLIVDRFNVPVTRTLPFERGDLSPAHYHDLWLCVKTIPDYYAPVDQNAVPWILGAALLPKVMARAKTIRAVIPGGHSITPAGDRPLRQVKPADLVIAHVPFSTFERFERKVVNICEIIRDYPDFFSGRRAWHWTRWAAQLHSGTLRGEFARQVFDERQIATLIANGAIRNAADVFADAQT